MYRTSIFVALLFPLFSFAAEYMPYPKAEISKEQWQTYFDEVKLDFANTERAYSEHNLVTYSDDSTRMNFAFTMEGHPAHPSWITRRVIQSDQSVDMQQIGFFAGDEQAFATLFQQYAHLTEQTKKQLRAGAK
ncbi:hypothetical protein A9Q79_01785 [Methylophaga sp. 42_25_T18]|nr:hypothetical protein A9Q79_01785 [Methylophaga sp. 42_25_T18]